MDQKTQLHDTALWFDGILEVNPDKVADFLLLGVDIKRLSVTDESSEIHQFNTVSGQQLKVKTSCSALDKSFQIPQHYKDMDLRAYFLSKQEMRKDSDLENERRIARIENELVGYEEHQYTDVLRTIIYMIDVLREKKVVWGVGRGSSCASYCLFLTGLHLVDPVKYNIHYSEFLHS